jgi:pimeloyl-ACP methyl ester carboxylesterase
MTVVTQVELVELMTEDGIGLHGFFAAPPTPASAVLVHVHGKCGNFYQNRFVRIFARELPLQGIALLSVNTRGHDCVAEMMVDGELRYLGGSLELFAESARDLDAMVKFAAARAPTVVLQGHSYGCEKVAAYAAATPVPAVLLSPSPSAQVQELYCDGMSLGEQAERMRQRKGHGFLDLADAEDYGVDVGGHRYPIPISRSALLDAFSSGALALFDWDARGTLTLAEPVLAYLGVDDPYRLGTVEQACGFFSHATSSFTPVVVPGGDHHMTCRESTVATEIANWITRSICTK